MIGARDGTLFYCLYGDVPLDRVWFLASLSKTMHTILCESVLNIICNCPKQGMVAQLSSLTVWLIGDFCWYLNLLIETLKNCIKRWSVYFTICSKQGPKMEGAALHGVGILGLFLVLKRVRVSYPQRHPNMG